MFKSFITKKIIQAALTARENGGICDRAHFGDCNDIVKQTLILLKGMPIRRQGGLFITNPAEDEEWEHTWLIVYNHILDPTIDQFFSSLDVDLVTAQPGIYYSAPEWDGDWLVKRYKVY